MARKGILGKKVGMTQVFTDNGELVPVTVVDVTPNVVMQYSWATAICVKS